MLISVMKWKRRSVPHGSSVGERKEKESPTGVEHMTKVECSNRWVTRHKRARPLSGTQIFSFIPRSWHYKYYILSISLRSLIFNIVLYWSPRIFSRKTRWNIFVSFEQWFQLARKQTRLPIVGKNLRKRYFIVCHVTKYAMILGVRHDHLVFFRVKQNGIFSFRLNNGFSLPGNKHGHQSLEKSSENAILSCVTWQNTPWFLE